MSDFDEISRAVGKLEGKIEELCKSQNAVWKELRVIEQTLSNQRTIYGRGKEKVG